MSVFRRLLLIAKSVASLVKGGGEASETGAVNIGWAAISTGGGGVGIWTFPLNDIGAASEGYGGNVSNVGGVGV